MNAKTFVQRFFIILGLLILTATGYALYFARHYPLPITDRISFDAKLQFVRQKIDPDQIDTIILGSSIGMNNLLGERLAKKCRHCRHVLNLSVYEATALEVEQLMQLIDAFPHVERILYSVQYSDLPHDWRYQHYDPKRLIAYMRHELGPLRYAKLLFESCRNIFFCIRRQWEWGPKHMQPNRFEYLGFDASASVPLHIYGKDIIPGRWRTPHPGVMANVSFEAIYRMIQTAKQRHIQYYVVHQPYRKGLYDSRQSVRNAMAYFDKRIEQIIKPLNYGVLIRVQPYNLSDAYFSDRTHLNDRGSARVTDIVANIIDQHESNKTEKETYAIYPHEN